MLNHTARLNDSKASLQKGPGVASTNRKHLTPKNLPRRVEQLQSSIRQEPDNIPLPKLQQLVSSLPGPLLKEDGTENSAQSQTSVACCCHHQIQTIFIFFHEIVKCFTFNIWCVLYLLKLANHCILFLSTFYTACQLFWNWGYYFIYLFIIVVIINTKLLWFEQRWLLSLYPPMIVEHLLTRVWCAGTKGFVKSALGRDVFDSEKRY